ncbi:ethanolamine ammonia-lyase subunit EutB, partial [Mycolicibacterium insubricum]
CVLSHITTTIGLIEAGAPVDLPFQSIAGTEAANRAFGVDIALLREGRDAARSLHRGTVGDNVMYLETGQGSALSSG